MNVTSGSQTALASTLGSVSMQRCLDLRRIHSSVLHIIKAAVQDLSFGGKQAGCIHARNNRPDVAATRAVQSCTGRDSNY